MKSCKCPDCSIAWPVLPLYKLRCGVCLSPTEPSQSSPITQTEAKKLSDWADFDRFYTKREQDRQKRGDLDPETLGLLDARQHIASVKEVQGLPEVKHP